MDVQARNDSGPWLEFLCGSCTMLTVACGAQHDADIESSNGRRSQFIFQRVASISERTHDNSTVGEHHEPVLWQIPPQAS